MKNQFIICFLLFTSTILSANPVENADKTKVPFKPEQLKVAESNLEIRRISALLDVAFRQKRTFEIPVLMEELKKAGPESAAYNYFRGLDLFTQSRRLEGLALFNEAVTKDPNFAPARNMLGVIYMDAGKDAAALEQFRKCVDQSPHDPTYLLNLGIAFMKTGSRKDAADTFEKAINAKSNLAEAHFYLGIMQKENGQSANAMTNLAKAIEFALNDPAVYKEYIDLCFDQGQLARIQLALDKISSSGDPELIRITAMTWYRLGSFAASANYYERLIGSNGSRAQDRKAYVTSLIRSGRSPIDWIRSARITEEEKSELMDFQTTLSQQPYPSSRDPVIKPTR